MNTNFKIAFIHTVPFLAEQFQTAAVNAGIAPGDIFHLIEPGLFSPGEVVQGGSTAKASIIENRVAGLASMGIGAVLITCSALGVAIDIASKNLAIPVLRIDQALVSNGVASADRIAVLSTHPEGLEDTVQLVRDLAKAKGRTVGVQGRTCDGAFAKLAAGDTAGHDLDVAYSITELLKANDLVLLAQPSMARVIKLLPAEEQPRALTSIDPGVHALKNLMLAHHN